MRNSIFSLPLWSKNHYQILSCRLSFDWIARWPLTDPPPHSLHSTKRYNHQYNFCSSLEFYSLDKAYAVFLLSLFLTHLLLYFFFTTSIQSIQSDWEQELTHTTLYHSHWDSECTFFCVGGRFYIFQPPYDIPQASRFGCFWLFDKIYWTVLRSALIWWATYF